MKTSSLLLIFLALIVAVSGCTVNINTGSNSESSQQNNSEIVGPADTVTTDVENTTNLDNEETEIPDDETEEEVYEDIECEAISSKTFTASTNDTVENAKLIDLCSKNLDIMNGVNFKYYTFTLTKPARIYAMLDSFETGAWQIGLVGLEGLTGDNGEPVKYTTDLRAGTYTIYIRVTNALGSTCTGTDCCFEFFDGGTCWWIQGSPAGGVVKLSYNLTLSTSEMEPFDDIVIETNTTIPQTKSCSNFSSKIIERNITHNTAETAYPVALCDEVNDIFSAATYQYYTITLAEETDVKFTLTKPEGRWSIGVNDYSWEDSVSMGEESVVYSHTLPAGIHKAWVMVTNTAGLSGSDWTCREIIANGTCYWMSGSPVNGTYYLNYEVKFDAE